MIRTSRYGRVIKKPVLYVPAEHDFVDDFKDEDYDSDDTLDSSEVESIVTSGDEEDSGSDLDDFIDSDSEEDCD